MSRQDRSHNRVENHRVVVRDDVPRDRECRSSCTEKLAAEVCLECRRDVDGVEKLSYTPGITTSIKDTRHPTFAQMKFVMQFDWDTALIRGSDILDENDTEGNANR